MSLRYRLRTFSAPRIACSDFLASCYQKRRWRLPCYSCCSWLAQQVSEKRQFLPLLVNEHRQMQYGENSILKIQQQHLASRNLLPFHDAKLPPDAFCLYLVSFLEQNPEQSLVQRLVRISQIISSSQQRNNFKHIYKESPLSSVPQQNLLLGVFRIASFKSFVNSCLGLLSL